MNCQVMKKKRVSIKDIASALKVTPSTVSRALNNGDRVGKKTRQEIINLATQWGYRPNPIARSMLSGKTLNIGLLLPEFTHHFFNRILEGVESVTYPKGYHLLICTSNELREKEIKSCRAFVDAQVDGIIAAIGNREDDFLHFAEILEEDIPLLLVDRMCEEINTPHVITDDFEGATKAVSYLIQTDCKKILHIKGPDYVSTSFNRQMGYQHAFKLHNLPLDDSLIIDGNLPDLEARIDKLLDTQSIDGIFAFSDYYAYKALKVLAKRGLNVPNDVSVIGFADEPIASYLSPKLSTVSQPAFEMGREAAHTLLKAIETGNGHPEESKVLGTTLILRETTR